MNDRESKPYIYGESNLEDFAVRKVPEDLEEERGVNADQRQEDLTTSEARFRDERKESLREEALAPNYNRDKGNARGNIGREVGDKYADMEEETGAMLEALEGIPDEGVVNREFTQAETTREAIQQALDSGAGIGALNMEDLANMGIDFTNFYGKKDVERLMKALNEKTGEKWDGIRGAINEGLNELMQAGASDQTMTTYLKRILTFSSIAYPEKDKEVSAVVQDGIAKLLPHLRERASAEQKAA